MRSEKQLIRQTEKQISLDKSKHYYKRMWMLGIQSFKDNKDEYRFMPIFEDKIGFI